MITVIKKIIIIKEKEGKRQGKKTLFRRGSIFPGGRGGGMVCTQAKNWTRFVLRDGPETGPLLCESVNRG